MELKIINVSDILANFYQPRTKFDKEKIKELSKSILSNGLINPVTVTPDKKRRGKYMIVSGERRWQGHRTAKIKTIPCFIKEYSTDGQFMVESLIENIHREDLSDSETWKFIKKIGKEMGWGIGRNLNVKVAGDFLKMPEWRIKTLKESFEHTTPEVRKALEQGKIALDTASEISRVEPEVQEQIGKEALKREEGMRRSEVREIIREPTPEPIQLERTANDIMDNILSSLHDFKYNVDELKKDNLRDISKSKAGKAMTTSGLHVKTFREFVNILRQTGAKPHPLILALIKANGKA